MYFENMIKAVFIIIGLWLASLVFLVVVSMHIVKIFSLNVNAWLVGGITAVVYTIISALWVYMINIG